MNETLGFAHFLSHADGLARGILLLLLAASIGTWYLIAIKYLGLFRLRRGARAFLQRFWSADSMETVVRELDHNESSNPFSHVLHQGFSAVETLRSRTSGTTRGLIESTSSDDFLTRAFKRTIDRERAKLNHGQSYLAIVASTSPFVGLFGTVWSIYHALIAIGLSGQGTLDKVAGPVGEALIMTAIGLAAAIPASVAYNNFARHNRNTLAEINDFAHDVFSMLSTGVKKNSRASDPTTTREQLLSLVRADGDH